MIMYIYGISHECPQLILLLGSDFFFLLSFLCLNIVEFCKPLSKLNLPALRQGSRERKNIYIYSFYIHIHIYICTYG